MMPIRYVKLIFFLNPINMLYIINNPWVSGIGGGIISGLIVYFVTNWLLSKKQKKEYLQKVTTANNEILYSVRPLIAQKQIPSFEIIDSIIESIARKYEVNKKDLLDMPLLFDDLIREVMENAFLDSIRKVEFCKEINELKSIHIMEDKNYKFQNVLYSKNRISSEYLSSILAMTVTTMTIAITVIFALRDKSIFISKFSSIVDTPLLLLVSVLIPIMATLTVPDFEKALKRIISKFHEQENELKKEERKKD
jgi:hypothetical protein